MCAVAWLLLPGRATSIFSVYLRLPASLLRQPLLHLPVQESSLVISTFLSLTTLLSSIGKPVALWRFNNFGPAPLGRSRSPPANSAVGKILCTFRRSWCLSSALSSFWCADHFAPFGACLGHGLSRRKLLRPYSPAPSLHFPFWTRNSLPARYAKVWEVQEAHISAKLTQLGHAPLSVSTVKLTTGMAAPGGDGTDSDRRVYCWRVHLQIPLAAV